MKSPGPQVVTALCVHCAIFCRDKADEGRTVDAQGMDGFLGVIQSAMAKKKEQADQAPETDADAPEDAAAVSHASDSTSFEAVMARKAKLKLEKKLAEMDRYERKRFELEQGLLQPSAPARREDAGGAGAQTGADEEAGGPKPGQREGGSEGGKSASKAPEEAAAPRKRTAQEKIEAARARAKERKLNR